MRRVSQVAATAHPLPTGLMEVFETCSALGGASHRHAPTHVPTLRDDRRSRQPQVALPDAHIVHGLSTGTRPHASC
jgi:hypothetical protein